MGPIENENEIRGFAMMDDLGRLLFYNIDTGVCSFKDLNELDGNYEIIVFGTPDIFDMLLYLKFRYVQEDLRSMNLSALEVKKITKTKNFTIL